MSQMIRILSLLSVFFFSSQLMAATLISWDFENPVNTGNVSSFAPTTAINAITGSASQTGGGGLPKLFSPPLFI